MKRFAKVSERIISWVITKNFYGELMDNVETNYVLWEQDQREN